MLTVQHSVFIYIHIYNGACKCTAHHACKDFAVSDKQWLDSRCSEEDRHHILIIIVHRQSIQVTYCITGKHLWASLGTRLYN